MIDPESASVEQGGEITRRLRASNRKVAWTLSSIAIVFFAGIIVTRWLGGGTIGIGVMGTAVLLFLVIAIGRNLRRTDERGGRSESRNGAAGHGPADADSRRADCPKAANGTAR